MYILTVFYNVFDIYQCIYLLYFTMYLIYISMYILTVFYNVYGIYLSSQNPKGKSQMCQFSRITMIILNLSFLIRSFLNNFFSLTFCIYFVSIFTCFLIFIFFQTFFSFQFCGCGCQNSKTSIWNFFSNGKVNFFIHFRDNITVFFAT